MTISTAAAPLSFAGNGSVTAFAITWSYNAKSHVVATLRDALGVETVQVLTTNYTLTDAGASGTLTMGVAPATGETLVITSEPPNTQETDIPLGGSFPASSVEDALDLASQVSQKVENLFDRSLRVPKTDTRSGSQLEFPNETLRADKVLAFNASGDPIAGEYVGNWTGNWATATAYTLRDIIKDTSNSNIYINITAHTSTGAQPISSNADVAKWALIVDAAAAAASAAAAAADVVLTNADVVLTHADVVLTHADEVLTRADTVATAADLVATNQDTIDTAADLVATNQDTIDTAADKVATNADVVLTNADVLSSEDNQLEANDWANRAENSLTRTFLNGVGTNRAAGNYSTLHWKAKTVADEILTNADTIATAADVVLTHADVVLTAADVVSTATSTTAAATSATASATSATASAASATAAAATKDSIDEFYLGAQSSNPTVDNNGDAVTAGDWYFNSSSNETRIYNGSTWQVTAISASGFLTAANNLSDLANAGTARTNLGLGSAATTATTAYVSKTAATGSASIPVGTTAQRDGSPSTGYLRYNSTEISFEGYNGSSWGSIGGGATGAGGDTVFQENSLIVTTDYTITSGKNASMVGPLTVNSTITLTIPSGARLVIL